MDVHEMDEVDLDIEVAKIAGLDYEVLTSPRMVVLADKDVWGNRRVLYPQDGADNRFTPSTNWGQGGPWIERFGISLVENLPCSPGRNWEARPSRTAKGAGWRCYGYGPTPLIAAMRCLVANNRTAGGEP